MRNFKSIAVFCTFFILLTTSCSKDSDNSLFNKQLDRTATLSFGAVLNDMMLNKDQIRQALEDNIPECSNNSPAYVEVVISGVTNVGTMENPVVIKVVANSGQSQNNGNSTYFTLESVDLELEPGNYSLDYFAVLDGDPQDPNSKIIWVAPSSDGEFSNFVDAAIPINFELRAGTKKYLNVEVLCYDQRLADEYGYLFFDAEVVQYQPTQAIDFCVFGSFCDEVGRSHLAKYKVSGWMYSGDPQDPKGKELFINRENSIIITDYEDSSEMSSEPLCMQLPDHDGEDLYYMEISIMPFNYDCQEKIIRKGVVTDTQVKSMYLENDRMSYCHFREGNCNMEDSPEIFIKT